MKRKMYRQRDRLKDRKIKKGSMPIRKVYEDKKTN